MYSRHLSSQANLAMLTRPNSYTASSLSYVRPFQSSLSEYAFISRASAIQLNICASSLFFTGKNLWLYLIKLLRGRTIGILSFQIKLYFTRSISEWSFKCKQKSQNIFFDKAILECFNHTVAIHNRIGDMTVNLNKNN